MLVDTIKYWYYQSSLRVLLEVRVLHQMSFLHQKSGSEFGDWVMALVLHYKVITFSSPKSITAEVVYLKRLEAAEDGAEEAFTITAHLMMLEVTRQLSSY